MRNPKLPDSPKYLPKLPPLTEGRTISSFNMEEISRSAEKLLMKKEDDLAQALVTLEERTTTPITLNYSVTSRNLVPTASPSPTAITAPPTRSATSCCNIS